MQETTLAALDPAALAAAFNRVYEAYVVPLQFDQRAIEHHLQTNDVALDASPLWLDDAGEVLGLAALGVRESRGWVGGFGLARSARGRGLSHGLIEALLAAARRRRLRQVQLEVLTNNPAAIHVYERAGFVHQRTLRLFARVGDAPAIETMAADRVQPADPATLLPHHERLRPARPAWQREPASLARVADLRGLALGPAGQPDAYLLHQVSEQRRSVTLWEVAASEPETIAALLGALISSLPGYRLSILNEPEESPVCAALEGLGFIETLSQYEMRFRLA